MAAKVIHISEKENGYLKKHKMNKYIY